MTLPLEGGDGSSAVDTIAALSSPPGPSLTAVVRLDGPEAIRVAEGLFRERGGQNLQELPGHSWRTGSVACAGLLVPCVLFLLRSPRSYTRSDTAELHLPGSMPLVQAILSACFAAGARPARPGEFTRRAFESGRLDLTQVEAVCRRIQADDVASLRRSAEMMGGGLGRRIADWQGRLRVLQGLLVAMVDFLDQELDEGLPADAASILDSVRTEIDAALGAPDDPIDDDRGVRVLFSGLPNAGKSSLFNRLLGDDRAIVASLPGTTRDRLEGEATFAGVDVILVDTPGDLDDGGEGLERAAQEGARRAREVCDRVVCVIDGADRAYGMFREHFEGVDSPKLLVLNKMDSELFDPEGWAEALGLPRDDLLEVSAVTGEGLEALRERIRHSVLSGAASSASALVGARQRDALRRAGGHLETAGAALIGEGLGPEFASIDLESALESLGGVVGEITTDEVLEVVFSRFCIGK